MPPTFKLISSNTLSSTTSSVTFSSIPATYTDLMLRWSARLTVSGRSEFVLLRFNGSSSTVYSETRLGAQSTTVYTDSQSNTNSGYTLSFANGATSQSNSFASTEIYIPSYTSSVNKPYSVFNVMQDNQHATRNNVANAELWRDTTAISTILLYPDGGTSFASGSSFYLYGIKNS